MQEGRSGSLFQSAGAGPVHADRVETEEGASPNADCAGSAGRFGSSHRQALLAESEIQQDGSRPTSALEWRSTAPLLLASNQECRESTRICKILHCGGSLESGRFAAWATSARTCGLLARKSGCLRLTSPSAAALSRERSAGSSAGYATRRSLRWKSSLRPSRCPPAGCSTSDTLLAR
jgi:hypothetical protein